jgi:hypothetical protein
MSPILKTCFATLALLSLGALSGCVQEGHSPECEGLGGSALIEDGCVTPVGGSCLDEEDFKKGRPKSREDGSRTVTIADDWVSYQEARPLCDFPCMTEEEFKADRGDSRRTTSNDKTKWISLNDDYDDYVEERRPDCAE